MPESASWLLLLLEYKQKARSRIEAGRALVVCLAFKTAWPTGNALAGGAMKKALGLAVCPDAPKSNHGQQWVKQPERDYTVFHCQCQKGRRYHLPPGSIQ